MPRAALLGLALAGCAGTRYTIAFPLPGARIPAELVSNTPVVRARVGTADLALTFDTGAEPISITPEGAARAHLALTLRTVSFNGGSSHLVQSSRRTRVAIGPVVLKNVEALVVPASSDFAELTGSADDGVFGVPMLAPMLVTIDYPARQLKIERGALPEPNGMDIVPYLSGNLPRISISVAGTAVGAIIDSGCSGTLVLPEKLEETLPLRGAVEAGGVMRTINGDRRPRTAKLDGAVKVGGYSIMAPVVDFVGDEALLCGNVLREFAVTLDSSHRRVRFSRPTFAPFVVSSPVSLGFVVRKHDGKWVVANLRPATAPPGVAIGDEIISYNGEDCAELTIDGLSAIVRESTAVHVVLRRAGQVIALDAPVHEL